MDDHAGRIDDLTAALTLAEAAALTAGVDLWNTPALTRLGIPALRVTDGPNGARGPRWTGVPAACFPCGAALGASWDPGLVERVGAALGAEARTKGAHVLLAPTVNLHRHPLGGRHFESYSEDPHLTARLAVAFVRGVQSQGVGTTVKHFVANDTEHERMTISSDVDEAVLRELYLLPFEAAVREAGAWGVMSAYNRLNGTYCSEHEWLLTTVLRDEWGFDGFVISDWYGTHSTAPAANAGLDLEMPGPPQHLGPELVDAVEAGAVTDRRVRAMARTQLQIRARAGAFDGEGNDEARSVDDPDRRALARETAAAAMVLLRNEGDLLPLAESTLHRVAVVGPGADALWIMGGGSATVDSQRAVTPIEGIRARAAAAGIDVTHEPGTSIDRRVPVVTGHRLEDAATIEYFASPEPTGEPVHVERLSTLRMLWMGELAAGLAVGAGSVRVRARLRADAAGDWTLGITTTGPARLLADGLTVLDNRDAPAKGRAFFGFGRHEVSAPLPRPGGEAADLVLEMGAEGEFAVAGFMIGATPTLASDAKERAVAAARAADVAIVVVGTGPEWESEGEDRATMDLPGDGVQDDLVRAVRSANPRTVVCVNTGAPVTMDWAADVPAILQCWLPGMEWGDALADVLFGDREPSGRLPTSFPRRLADAPAAAHYPGSDGHVRYGEGLLVGYRGFDRTGIEPRFCFGHGLGYTRFEYGVAEATTDEVTVAVTNIGPRAGSEVVQAYVHRPDAPAERPEQELRGFARVRLQPGETQSVTVPLAPRAWSEWRDGGWRRVPGRYVVRVGRSSRDVRSEATVMVADK